VSSVVYKYRLGEPGLVYREQVLTVPRGAKPMLVAEQGEYLCLWLLVDLREPEARVLVYVIGTGEVVPARAEHLGSGIRASGNVWHVYYGGEVQA